MYPGLVIVSNRLPVSVKKTDGKLEFYPSIGGLATGLSTYTSNKRNRWIGWPGIANEDINEDERRTITKELKKHNCYPVFLSQKELDGFYNGFANSVLWPLLHDLTPNKEAAADESFWRAYKRVNQAFGEVVLSLSTSGTTIWVHDYQLMLLPSMLRVQRPHDKIGFFLHIPFPSSKIFANAPHGAELLGGLAGADLLGFHTTSYVQNFLSCCQHFDIGTVGPKELILPDRVIRVTDFPMGIDYAKFVRATKQAAVRRELLKLRTKYRGKKVIVSVDRMDVTKGIVPRLDAYRAFLEQNPQFHRKVVLVMIAIPSRTDTDAYKKLRKQIDDLVHDIEDKFGTARWKPIEYITTPLSFTQLSPYFQLADIALVTPIRDGMNLVAKEYIASQGNQDGILVLSKTAGAAEELKQAIIVDPTKRSSLVSGIKEAMLLPQDELRERVSAMQDHISEFTVQEWASNFMGTLKKPVKTPHMTRSLSPSHQRMLVDSFRRAQKRLLLLDYDGVLAPFRSNPYKAGPSPKVLKVLRKLAKLP
ncbi:bifunctional alpha,alpha-trehalose-phosphate synthase (UDP-forming)/trehalose-phosphatase, partial [Candidatus Saccharibacteria bacterium]|nr:bifunctional alpha,alpha-trehalose-phosphate synthase (UDP-forming)/trehalose-phosphatase [Candidatus Saccharibacteria bacterium]